MFHWLLSLIRRLLYSITASTQIKASMVAHVFIVDLIEKQLYMVDVSLARISNQTLAVRHGGLELVARALGLRHGQQAAQGQ